MSLPEAKIDEMRKRRYRLYLDESGDHVYNCLDDPNFRCLCLLGIWIEQGDPYNSLARNLGGFKNEVFGEKPDDPVVLTRQRIIERSGDFRELGKDAELEKSFRTNLIELAKRTEFTMVAVVIDKKAHLNNYLDPYPPYHYCLGAMLDRYSGWLRFQNAVGDVMAESRGGRLDMQLKDAYSDVWDTGAFSMFGRQLHQGVLTSKQIKIKPKSANIAGLQLADQLAHPAKHDMMAEEGLIDSPREDYSRELYLAVNDKFNRKAGTGQLSGYGKVWLTK